MGLKRILKPVKKIALGLAAATLLGISSAYAATNDWTANITLKAKDASKQEIATVNIGATNNATRAYDMGIDSPSSAPTNDTSFYSIPDSGLESKLDTNYINITNLNESFTFGTEFLNGFSPTSTVINVGNLEANSSKEYVAIAYSSGNSNTAYIEHQDIIDNQDIAFTNTSKQISRILLRPRIHMDTNFPAVGDYATLQEAADSAKPGDAVDIGPGKWPGKVAITNLQGSSLTFLGEGPNRTFIHYYQPIAGDHTIYVEGPGTFEANGFNDIGSTWNTNFGGYWSGTQSIGIKATNDANLILNNMDFNRIGNFQVFLYGGTLNGHSIVPNSWASSLGGEAFVKCRDATVNLINVQHDSDIHHLFNAENSTVTITDSKMGINIDKSSGHVFKGNNSTLSMTNCEIYHPGGGVPQSSMTSKVGITLSGPSNTLNLSNVKFSGLDSQILIDSRITTGNNKVRVEDCQFNNYSNAVIVNRSGNTNNDEIDFGGGSLGSIGGNIFSNSAPPGYFDIVLTNSTLNPDYLKNVHFLNNQLSSTNKEAVKYDKKDDPLLGRVITENPRIVALPTSNGKILPSGTNEVPYGGGITFTLLSDPYYSLDSVRTNDTTVSGLSGGSSNTFYWANVIDDGNLDISSDANKTPDNLPHWWLASYGQPTNDAAGSDNPDGDGDDNLKEYIADTNPTNNQSYLKISGINKENGLMNISVDSSSTGRIYTLYGGTNLENRASWPATTNSYGNGGELVLKTIGPTNKYFYYVGAKLP